MSDRDSEDELRRSRKRETNRISRARNKDRVNAERRVRYATDPEFRAKVLKDARKDTLKRKYGLSLQDYDKMLAQQAGVCKICRRNSAARLSVDHCHEADELRSLLCNNCNPGLGRFRDSPALLRLAAAYIERWRRIHAGRRARSSRVDPEIAGDHRARRRQRGPCRNERLDSRRPLACSDRGSH
jgi:Recombination endonuclease VII